MNFAEYQQIDAVNYSSLKHMRVSPWHYKYRIEHPQPASKSMLFGRAAHTVLLEPEAFDRQYVTYEGDRRKREYKEFKSANADKEILDVSDYHALRSIWKSVYSHPLAGLLRGLTKTEHSIVWPDATTDIKCKCRIDGVGADYILEIKTTRHTSIRAFARDYAIMSYHIQAAMYQDAYYSDTDKWLDMICLAVQSAPPYDCVFFDVPDRVLEQGRNEYGELLERLQWCYTNDQWPRLEEQRIALPFPEWAYFSGDDSETVLTINGEQVAV